MLRLCFRLAAAIHAYLTCHLPTNRAVARLRSPRGLKWAIPVALVATPAYLFAMSICVVIIQRGGPGYLNVLVMLFSWNALKFAAVGVLAPLIALRETGERRLLRDPFTTN